jgi:hypothetical protein
VSISLLALAVVIALFVGAGVGYAVSRPATEQARNQRDAAREQLTATQQALESTRNELDDLRASVAAAQAANPACIGPPELRRPAGGPNLFGLTSYRSTDSRTDAARTAAG